MLLRRLRIINALTPNGELKVPAGCVGTLVKELNRGSQITAIDSLPETLRDRTTPSKSAESILIAVKN